MIRTLVVDDHDLFRMGVTSLLAREPDIEIVGQASGGRRGVQLALELTPDVTLMDLSMPDLSGIEAIEAIRTVRTDARVLALTVATDDETIEAALRAGASGYLSKDTAMQNLAGAVRAAAEGAAWLSPEAASAVLDRLRGAADAKPVPSLEATHLSPRELAVLRLVARGLDNLQIAAELEISAATTKSHVSNILAKLGVHSRMEAAIYAVRSGLD
jgi:DNA-binding NarL/FixJ family response regulator